MGQIVTSTAKPKRCNLSALQNTTSGHLGATTPAAGEIILVSSDNSMDANGCGNFDGYIKGDGTTTASNLVVKDINGLDASMDISVSLTQKKYIDANSSNNTFGQSLNINNSSYYVSDYISVFEKDKITFISINGSGDVNAKNNGGYVFYDAEKGAVSGVITMTGSYSYGSRTVEVPSNVAFFRFSGTVDNSSIHIERKFETLFAKKDEFLSFANNVNEALFPSDINTNNLSCSSSDTSKITVVNTSDNNYTITSIAQTSGKYGYLYLPTMRNNVQYRMQFSYTNTNTGSQDWVISDASGADVIRPAYLEYTTTSVDYSWDFTYTSNMNRIKFFCNNMVTGSVITITDLQFICLESYDVIVSAVEDLKDFEKSMSPNEISTNNLVCSSSDTDYLTVECVSTNNYLVTSISQAGYKYGYIQLPILSLNKKYRLTFDCKTENNLSASIAVSNSSGGGQTIIGNIPALTHEKYTAEFTYTGTNTSYLKFFCNDIQTGMGIALDNLEIVEADSLTALKNYVSSELTIGTSLYASQKEVSLVKRKPFNCTITNPAWTLANGQAMAIYNHYIVRIAKNGTLTLAQYSNNAITTIFTSSNSLAGHNNSAQFAPYKNANQDFPYLYVSAFEDTGGPICKVYELTTSSVTLVQTIGFDLPETIMGANDGKNTQIGDDGCLYVYSLTSGVVKLATPAVSVGDVTLTSSSVLDFFRFYYPYSNYVWQGGTIYNGMLFMPVGGSSTNTLAGLFVFDLASHSLLTEININKSVWGGEIEDCDVMDNKLYVSALYGNMTVFDFDPL